MKLKLLFLNILLCTIGTFAQNPVSNSVDRKITNITAEKALDFLNTIIYGPYDNFCITEHKGKQIVKVSTNGRTLKTILNLMCPNQQSEHLRL